MNNTSDSYQAVIKQEINRWSGFHRALRKEDRETSEQLMEIYRNNAHANEAASNQFPFETMIMSILLHQQLKIKQLQKKLQALTPKFTQLGACPNGQETCE